MFNEFLVKNPNSDRANLYFQIGIRAYEMTKKHDPINQYKQYLAYTDNADSVLRLCLKYLNEAEVKRDNAMFKQYINVTEKNISFAVVYNYVDSIINYNRELIRNARNIHAAYFNLTRNYVACQRVYKSLCDNYSTVKEIYLMIDSPIFDKLKEIDELSDSIDYYLNEYKLAVEKDTIQNKKISIKTADIDIFRIDGINLNNFRSSEIVVWNYRQWAKNIMENVDVMGEMYQEVINASNYLSKRINFFSTNRTLSDNYVSYDADREAIDSLNKIACYPSLNCYLAYKEEKLNFFTLSRRKINSPDYNDKEKLDLRNKLYYYDELLLQYNNLDYFYKKLEDYAASNNNSDFVAMNFKNKAEFIEYINEEKLENEVEISIAFDNLLRYYNNKENSRCDTNYIKYGNQKIPLFQTKGFYRSANFQTYITKCISDTDNGIYLAGSLIDKSGNSLAYTALCAKDKSKIMWLKIADINKNLYDDCVTALYPLNDGGCFVLISSKSTTDSSLINNTIIQYNAKGIELKRISLFEKTLGVGRYINYNDVNEQLLLAFHGKNEIEFEPDTQLLIQKIDMKNNVVMKSEVKFSGNLVNILTTNDSCLLVVGNYSSIIDENGVKHKLHSDSISMKSGIFTAFISNKGQLTKLNRYKLNIDAVSAIEAIKITNNSFNIIGLNLFARKDSIAPYNSNDFIYLSIDSEGNLLYANKR
jgi:hypothetical protein